MDPTPLPFFLVEKCGLFFQQRGDPIRRVETLAQRIFGTISEHGRGWVFSPEEFRDFGDPRVIGVALGRMVSTGKIRRLTRGLYDYPKASEHGPLAPDPDAIARALVGRHNLRLVPAGAYAANLLGLWPKSSRSVVFLTDGPSRTVHVGGQDIRLKQTTPRNVGPAGRISGVVIQALRHLGQQQVDDVVIQKLRKRLRADEKKQLLEDLPFAPEWVRTHLRSIAKEEA
jgi:hypothetical protein